MKIESVVGKNGLVWIKTEEIKDLVYFRQLIEKAAFMSQDAVEFEIDQYLQSKSENPE